MRKIEKAISRYLFYYFLSGFFGGIILWAYHTLGHDSLEIGYGWALAFAWLPAANYVSRDSKKSIHRITSFGLLIFLLILNYYIVHPNSIWNCLIFHVFDTLLLCQIPTFEKLVGRVMKHAIKK